MDAIEACGHRVAKVAPSANAAREVLRKDFPDADTLAAFKLNKKWQESVSTVLLDEMPLASIADVAWLCDWAKQKADRRLIFQGDADQHASPARNGNMYRVLQEYAGLKPGRLTKVWRQKHQGYKRVVEDIARGDRAEALDGLDYLGWVKEADTHAPLVNDYVAAVNAKKSVLVVSPTHAEGEAVTAAIRARLKAEGRLGDDTPVDTLRPLAWTDAEKGDPLQYRGDEVMQFHRNSGSFRAGKKVRVADWRAGVALPDPRHFAVYRPERLGLAAGDRVRITVNGKSKDGHRLNNGAVYAVKAVGTAGDVTLANGWTLGPDFKHLTHGYVATSHASQGKTVDRVLIAMGRQSLPAVSAEQFYVSVSRGRESARVYTDMPKGELRQAIQRTDPRTSATEVWRPRRKKRKLYEAVTKLVKKARDRWNRLHAGRGGATRDEKDRDHARER